MSRDVAEIFSVYGNGVDAGPRFTNVLSPSERSTLNIWLAEQRSADMPDENVWIKLLMGAKPFFHDIFETVISGRWNMLIRECAEPLDLAKEAKLVRDFPILGDLGMRFLLFGIDRQKIDVYAGNAPVLLDLRDGQSLWRIDTKNEDHVSVKKAELVDVPNVLLREWAKSRPRLKKARERLCDILSICLVRS